MKICLASSLLVSVALAGCGKHHEDGQAPATIEVALVIKSPLPLYPAWSPPFMGNMIDIKSKNAGECEGAFHLVKIRHLGQQGGLEVEGWGWLKAQKQPASQVLFANSYGVVKEASGTMVNRPDVKAAIPEATETKVGRHGEKSTHRPAFSWPSR
jgi:hypothetical protein